MGRIHAKNARLHEPQMETLPSEGTVLTIFVPQPQQYTIQVAVAHQDTRSIDPRCRRRHRNAIEGVRWCRYAQWRSWSCLGGTRKNGRVKVTRLASEARGGAAFSLQ